MKKKVEFDPVEATHGIWDEIPEENDAVFHTSNMGELIVLREALTQELKRINKSFPAYETCMNMIARLNDYFGVDHFNSLT